MNDSQSDDLNQVIIKAKRELEHMIDLNPQIMLLMDDQGVVLRANKALRVFLELGHLRDAIGQPVWSLLGCPESFIRTLLQSSEGYRTAQTETVLRARGKVLLEVSLIKSGSNLNGVIFRDITAEKDREKRTEKQHKRKAMQELAGALMHNINQPLTVITIRARLIQLSMDNGDMSPAEVGKGLEEIICMAESIAAIVSKAERPKDYVTETYSEGVQIVDLEKSGGSAAVEGISATGVGVLDALITILNDVVPDFAMHAHRTGEYAGFLARKMGRSEAESTMVVRAGLLHDIGKIGVPSDILAKATGLTGEEMAEVRAHVDIGKRLLRNFTHLKAETELVAAHHERVDGTGYPAGLRGDQIPILARILTVADTFDVLRYGRPYHEAMALDAIVAEIVKHSGTQFDPAVVEAFRANATEMDALCRPQ